MPAIGLWIKYLVQKITAFGGSWKLAQMGLMVGFKLDSRVTIM